MNPSLNCSFPYEVIGSVLPWTGPSPDAIGSVIMAQDHDHERMYVLMALLRSWRIVKNSKESFRVDGRCCQMNPNRRIMEMPELHK